MGTETPDMKKVRLEQERETKAFTEPKPDGIRGPAVESRGGGIKITIGQMAVLAFFLWFVLVTVWRIDVARLQRVKLCVEIPSVVVVANGPNRVEVPGVELVKYVNSNMRVIQGADTLKNVPFEISVVRGIK